MYKLKHKIIEGFNKINKKINSIQWYKKAVVIAVVAAGMIYASTTLQAAAGYNALSRLGLSTSWVYVLPRSFVDGHSKADFSAVNGNAWSSNWLCYWHTYMYGWWLYVYGV